MEAQIHSHVGACHGEILEKLIHERKKLKFSQISNAAVGHANDGGDGCNESRRIDLVNLAGLSAAPS